MSSQDQNIEPANPEVVVMARAAGQTPVCYVVDEDSSIRHFVSLIMQGSGIDTQEFVDGPAFRKAVAARAPDIVFINVPLDIEDSQKSVIALAKSGFRGAVQLMSSRGTAVLDPLKSAGEQHQIHMLPGIKKPFDTATLQRIVRDLKLGMPPPVAARIVLDDAIANGWIEFWYQPKIDLKRKKLVGVECLARARHPQHGVLPPEAFMPGALENSVSALAEKAVTEAVRASNQFAALGVHLPLSINMPLEILVQLAIDERLKALQPEPSTWPGLIVDLNEKSVISDVPAAIALAKKLAPHNVRLALDDFGNGHGALAKVDALPFAEIKISRAFVTDCSTDRMKAGTCKSAIDLAHKFGASAVAVGIERGGDVITLAAMGCDCGQGYLLGRPMPEARFVSLLRQRANLPKAS